MKIFKKASGQGLTEYLLILGLTVIVVIMALIVLGPIIDNLFSEINAELNNPLLNEVPAITDSGNPTRVYPKSSDTYYSRWVGGNDPCLDISVGENLLKVGTTYEDPAVISVARSGDTYTVCSLKTGAQYEILFQLTPPLR